MLKLIIFIAMFSISTKGFSDINLSETVSGLKYPNSSEQIAQGDLPVRTEALLPKSLKQGFTELLEYVLPSPNQDGAGSCLYMAITGNVEWHLAKSFPSIQRTTNGPLDLSERYLMNIAGINENQNGVDNWKTDTVRLFNHKGFGILNIDFPFTKGFYKQGKNGIIIASSDDPKAEYGASFNWINTLDRVNEGNEVLLPTFEREIIFADPDSNQWNVGVTPEDIVEQVKEALEKNRAPVLVMYNHYGYWHVHMITGFDDEFDTKDCSFTKKAIPYMQKKAQDYKVQLENAKGPKEKIRLEERFKRYTLLSQKMDERYKEIGGCKGRGAFYVRDSLYSNPDGVNYTYATRNTDDDLKMSKKIIMREYEYLRVLANHLTQIYPL